MAKYEYRCLHMPAGSISVVNERLASSAEDDWHPILMSGNESINILLRRQVAEPEQSKDE